jgi:hypothetical protein
MSFGFSSSKSQPENVTPDVLQGNYGPFAKALQGLLGTNLGAGGGNMGIPLSPFTGLNNKPNLLNKRLSAGMKPGEQNALSMLNKQSADPAFGSYLHDVIGGKYLTPDSNPFLEATIQAAQRPTQEALDQTLTRDLPGQFTRAGQFKTPGMGSSAFDTASALAYGRGASAMGDIATNIAGNAYGQERQLQQGAVGLNQQQTQNMVQVLQANALPRLIQQQGIDNGLKLFQQRIQSFLGALGVATSQSGMSNIGNSSSSSGFNLGLGGMI